MRQDLHRPGAIIPANYTHVLFYHGPMVHLGMLTASFNVDKVLELCRTEKVICKRGIFNCSVCGAHFNEGEVWKHNSGEYILIGHQCAEKYSLLADRSEYELEVGREKDALAKTIQAKINAEEREAFLLAHPGLKEALEFKHPIIEDIAKKFIQYRNLSDKQIAFVYKLIEEAKNPKPKDVHISAPIGRLTFIGEVISIKLQEGYGRFAGGLKMTVKVVTENGSWLAWGTVPRSMDIERGDKVEITATLSSGREPFFAFMKRPRGKVIGHDSMATANA